MSVSFIYQNLSFYYRIDSHSSSMPFIAWGCRSLPISGTNLASKEEMMEDMLEGINYIPSQGEIVNEVARRVARRLAEAQKAEKAMNEALGRK